MADRGLSVQQQRSRYSDLQAYFKKDNVLSRISKEINNKLLTPDKMTQYVLTAATKNRMLLECSPESLCLEIQKAGAMGLAPNGIDGHMVPFRNNKKGTTEVVFIPDYKGLIKLMYQSGMVIAVFANAVRAKDHFEYRFGHGSHITHHPFDADTLEGRGELKHAWALVELKGGGSPFVVLSRAEVAARKKVSRGSDSSYSPWQTHPDAMWAKSAIKQLSKFVPLTPELNKAMEADTKQDYGDSILDVESMASVPGMEDQSGDDEPQQEEPPQPTRTQRLAQKANEARGRASASPPKTKPAPEPDQEPEQYDEPADEGIDEPAPEEESQEEESQEDSQGQDSDPRDRATILSQFEEQVYSDLVTDPNELDVALEHNITFNQHKLFPKDRVWAKRLVDTRKNELADAAGRAKKGVKR